MPDPMTPMEQLLAAASAHVFSDSELRLLAGIALSQAVDALHERRYATATECISDALGHLRALREKANG